MRKLIRKWCKKLKVALAASAKEQEIIKPLKIAAATALIAASAQAGGGNYGGGTFDQNNTGGTYYMGFKPWSVWSSFWKGVTETWTYGIGSISKAFDPSSDPGQAAWGSGPIGADHGSSGPQVYPTKNK